VCCVTYVRSQPCRNEQSGGDDVQPERCDEDARDGVEVDAARSRDLGDDAVEQLGRGGREHLGADDREHRRADGEQKRHDEGHLEPPHEADELERRALDVARLLAGNHVAHGSVPRRGCGALAFAHLVDFALLFDVAFAHAASPPFSSSSDSWDNAISW
jgi:hypothetical protein